MVIHDAESSAIVRQNLTSSADTSQSRAKCSSVNRTKNRLINLSIVANFFYYFNRKSSSFQASRRVDGHGQRNGGSTHPTTKTQVGCQKRDNITIAGECKGTDPARDSAGCLSIRHHHNTPALKRQDTPAFHGERNFHARKSRGNEGKGKGLTFFLVTLFFFLISLDTV
jgi:hypothetical protein